MTEHIRQPIRVATAPGGPTTYLVDLAPQHLPPVRSGHLAEAWAAARDAASSSEWGHALLFRFRPGAEDMLDLALADEDACCWADAVDRTAGLRTLAGLSLCLRLLALVDLIARAPWLGRFCRIARAGAALDPALVRVAATVPLSADARFDEAQFASRLNRPAAPPLPSPSPSAGATA